MPADRSRVRRRIASLYGELMRVVLQRELKLDTDEQVWPDQLGFTSSEYNHYVPSQWPVLPIALRWRRPRPDDVFLDIGSGKGRVVLQAARYPFRRIIGLELSPGLNALAHANLDRNRAALRCLDVELITADLVNFELPDDVTIVYSFHVLTGSAFETLLDRLESLAARRRAPVHFIYHNACLHTQVVARPRIRLLKASRIRILLMFPLHLYEVAPPVIGHRDHGHRNRSTSS